MMDSLVFTLSHLNQIELVSGMSWVVAVDYPESSVGGSKGSISRNRRVVGASAGHAFDLVAIRQGCSTTDDISARDHNIKEDWKSLDT